MNSLNSEIEKPRHTWEKPSLIVQWAVQDIGSNPEYETRTITIADMTLDLATAEVTIRQKKVGNSIHTQDGETLFESHYIHPGVHRVTASERIRPKLEEDYLGPPQVSEVDKTRTDNLAHHRTTKQINPSQAKRAVRILNDTNGISRHRDHHPKVVYGQSGEKHVKFVAGEQNHGKYTGPDAQPIYLGRDTDQPSRKIYLQYPDSIGPLVRDDIENP